MFNFIKKSIIANRAEETILYEYVLDEIEDGYKVRGLWAKALAMSEGDENKATSLYMQYRVQNIKDFFSSLKIAYEELSKSQIKNKLVKSNEVEIHKVEEIQKAQKEIEKKEIKLNYHSNFITGNWLFNIFLLLGLFLSGIKFTDFSSLSIFIVSLFLMLIINFLFKRD